ncbi:MAG: dTDP-4-dehydrorhamnose reductase [Nitrososphaerota archaeon]
MKILITGAGGLLGSKISYLALKKNYKVYAAYLTHLPSYGLPIKLDISNEKMVFKIIKDINPDAIFHCAALTDVDKCEINKEIAKRININGTKIIAKIAKKINSHLIYISTDYVFDGSKGMYKEEDEPNPINFYGYSKLLGEKIIEKIEGEYLIARTSVIYGSKPASGKTNFALWILDNLNKNQNIKVLIDQYVSPTLNTNLAEMLIEAYERKLTGIYHLAGAERVSRYEFALKLAEIFNLNKNLIIKAKMDEMDWIAKRPKDTSLDTSKANNVFKVKPINLNEALNNLKEELKIA